LTTETSASPAAPTGPAGPAGTVTLRILRGRPADGGQDQRGQPGEYATFPVPTFPRMSVLDTLFAVQRHQDRSLSFRYSCRLGMCGTCAVICNDREVLACQTLVERLPGSEITLRPLNYLPVLKDLAVDLEPFFDRYRQVKPHFVPRQNAGGAGEAGGAGAAQVIRQGEGARKWVDPALGCISCGICHSACSVVGLNERFPGPAALNRAYTLTNDVRDGARAERLATVGGADGVWRCHQLFNCASACPRHLVPTQAIRQLRLDAGSEAPTPLAAPLRWLRGRVLSMARSSENESPRTAPPAHGDLGASLPERGVPPADGSPPEKD
jgi:succinate dehydrogenase / fumarate reductase, iron-sulfur subunit